MNFALNGSAAVQGKAVRQQAGGQATKRRDELISELLM
jgi:hypothetical protein